MLLDGILTAEKLAQVDADSPRESVERKFHAARVSHIEVQVGLRVETQSSGEAIVLVDGCAARRLVIGLKDAPVLAARTRRALANVAAEDRLHAPRSDVIR